MRSEEHSGATQLFGVEPTTCGCLGTDERVERMTTSIGLALTKRSCLRGGYVTRTDTITLDIVLTILRTNVAGEHFQSTLCGCIGTNSLAPQLTHHRADVDNLAFAALHHLGQHGRRTNKGSHKVDVDDLLELGAFHLVHGNALDDTGVVDKNVNLADFFVDGFHKGFHVIFLSNITDVALHVLDACFLVVIQTTLQSGLVDVVENDVLRASSAMPKEPLRTENSISSQH